jgi:homoserine O-acetyltransferase
MAVPLEPSREGDFTFANDAPFPLDGGGSLGPITLHYALYGEMTPPKDNVLLVCHALSGSARVGDWWADLLGPGKPFDTSRYCVLGINVLGSCYGSTGPGSMDPRTGLPYGGDFPVVSIRDMVRTQARLLDHLGVSCLHAVAGGSIGGMQALAWALEFPERVSRCVAIGAAPLSAMALALNHLQRQAIRNDTASPPAAGLALARAIATCSYKSAGLFAERFGRRPNRRAGEDPSRNHSHRFDVAGYLDHQGRVFIDRFDADSYLVITRAMDTFDVGREATDQTALEKITARLLLIGIQSDWLFPPEDVQVLANRLALAGVDATYAEIVTSHGHDGFLAHPELLAPIVAKAIEAPLGTSRVHRDTMSP